MKHILTLGVLLLVATAHAQDDSVTYNRFSLDANFGVNNPIAPMTPGYDAPTFGLFHVGLGTRFMASPRFGFRFGIGYDQFNEANNPDYDYPDFRTHYYNATLEGVINVGSVLHFENWTRRFGILMHAGLGYAIMHPDSAQGTYDHMLRAGIGLTPQFKLSERWNLYFDATATTHVYQDYMYDFTRRQANRGIDGFLYNFSLGVQVALGPHARHADWVPTISTRDQLEALENRINDMERDMRDDDNDGVPNYLDEEPNTPAGSKVDSKGRTVVEEARDSDSDNIPDDVDDCPFEKGTPANRGCPDRATGGNTDGSGSYPSSSTIAMVESSEVKFATDEATITPSFAQMLDGIATVMKDNPQAKLNITGHADDRASEEYNMALSQRRADAVRSYLMQKGIAGDRLTTTAKGESNPKIKSTTVEARAENRRVEFDVR